MRASSLLFVVILCFGPIATLAAQQPPSEVVALEDAQEIDVGSFCLANIPKGTITVGSSHIQESGTWWEVNFDVAASMATKPMAYFFSSLRPSSDNSMMTHCKDSATSSFLTGRLNTATIRAYYLPSSDSHSARWEVDPGKMNVEFGRAEAQIAPVYGAVVVASDARPGAKSLTGRKLWVSNLSTALFFDKTAGVQKGILDVMTTDVQLSNLTVHIGTVSLTTSLSCLSGPAPSQGHVVFSVNVTDGSPRFTSGTCTRRDVTFQSGSWDGAGVNIEITQAHANALHLIGSSTAPVFSVEGATLTASKLVYQPGIVQISPTQSVTVQSYSGLVDESSDAVHVHKVTWAGLSTAAADIQLAGAFPTSGKGSFQLKRLTDDDVEASFAFNSVRLPSIESVLPMSATSLALSIAGSPAAPFVSGSLSLSSIQMSRLGLQTGLSPINFQTDPSTGAIPALSFDLDLSTPTGTVSLSDPDGGNVSIQGQLAKLHLKGDILLKTSESFPTLTIDPGNLVLDARVQASSRPLILGSPVQFVGGTLSLATPTGLSLSKSVSQGALTLAATALIIPSPLLTFEDPKQNLLVQAPLQTDGAAEIEYDIGTGRTKLNNGRIDVDHLAAKSGDSARSVSFAGIDLISPELTLDHLIVAVTNGSGLIQGKALHFVTDSAIHNGSPYWKVGFAPNTGLSIPSFDAVLGESQESLSLQQLSLENLSLVGASAEFKSADGFEVAGDSFSISADQMTEALIKNGKFSIASGSFAVTTGSTSNTVDAHSSFDHFQLSLDGTQASFDGSGSIHLSNISAGYRSKLHIPDCAAGDGWKVTGGIHIDGVSLALQAQQGNVSGSGDANSGNAYIVNDGQSNCGWDHTYVISEAKWIDVNLCPPFSCHVKTIIVPKIDVTIYWEADLVSLNASASIDQATFTVGGGKGTRICLKRATLSPPVIVATYSPQIKSGTFVADFVHDLIRVVAAGAESPLATTLGTTASFTSYIAAALGTTICP